MQSKFNVLNSYILFKIAPSYKKNKSYSAAMPSSTNNTALCYAATSGNLLLCKRLINEYDCKVDVIVHKYATLSGDLDLVRTLIKLTDSEDSQQNLQPKI